MATTTPSRLLTAEDLWAMPESQRGELIRGELRPMAPSGSDHGAITSNTAILIGTFVKQNRLGIVFGAETGFVLSRDPDLVRAPDAAFVRASRVPASGRPVKYWDGAPDLAVEVLSPSDTAQEIEDKVADYVNAGTELVWVLNPKRKTLSIHKKDAATVTLRASDEVDGEQVLPGFRCQVAHFFE